MKASERETGIGLDPAQEQCAEKAERATDLERKT
jgi:hypothetical protein